ncbi:uncharacterized protein V6R79_017204 [Siganus canaliculatus]
MVKGAALLLVHVEPRGAARPRPADSIMTPVADEAMQSYWWPGYEKQLLGELQKQQNNPQFCDTFLQSEGISVPVHSCILAALSPYLSQRLSLSSPPAFGQKRQLELQAVNAQTLLKLVVLLYSGEVEVKGSVEQRDLLSAAHQFGITQLVEGRKDKGWIKEGALQARWERNQKMRDAQVQAEVAGRRAADCLTDERCCASTGTQTDLRLLAGEEAVTSSFSFSGHSHPPTPAPASSRAQNLDFSIILQPQNISLDNHLYSTCSPADPTPSCGGPRKRDAKTNRSLNNIAKPTSTSALSTVKSNFMAPQEGGSRQEMLELSDVGGIRLVDDERNPRTADRNGNTEKFTLPRMEQGNSTHYRCPNVGKKNLAMMEQLEDIETTDISIKVKLRRTTSDELWEVVAMQEAGKEMSLTNALNQTELMNGVPSSVRPGLHPKPLAQIPHPAATNKSPRSPLHSSDSALLCSECLTPNHNSDVESVLLNQTPAPIEETDEQLEKLLEDIMMGLNILPNLGEDRPKSHSPKSKCDGPSALCQDPVTENDGVQSLMSAAVSAAGFEHGQNSEKQPGLSSAPTAIRRCFVALDRPSCSGLLSTLPAVEQDHHRSAHCRSLVPSEVQANRTSLPGMPLPINLNRLYPEASSTPAAFYCVRQEHHHRANPKPTEQSISKFLPQSLRGLPLPRMDDLQLPRCLSPLPPFAPTANHLSGFGNLSIRRDKTHPQPLLHGRPWLTENPGSLLFPLSAVARREIRSTSVPKDANPSKWSETFREMPNKAVCHEKVEQGKADNCKLWRNRSRKPDDPEGDAVPLKSRLRKQIRPPKTCDSEPMDHRVKTVDQQTPSPLQRKRGRPPKMKDSFAKKCRRSESEQEIDLISPKEGEEGLQTKKRSRKRRRNRDKVTAIPQKKSASPGKMSEAEVDNSSDGVPAMRQPETPRPQLVPLKEFQRLIRRHHSKTRSEVNQSTDTNKLAEGQEGQEEGCDRNEKDIPQPQNRDEIEKSDVDISVDKNHNQIFDKSTLECSNSQPADSCSSAGQEDHRGVSSDMFGEVLAADSKQRPGDGKDGEVWNTCSAGAPDTEQQPDHTEDGSSHMMDMQALPLKHNSNLPADEEEEVDVLLYSPDRDPPSKQCENRLDNMEVSPEEDEEEDGHEIDVTGDEAE